ncbi:MAG: hypothetical protein R6V58_06910 [Planctomycetota bacterium]
MNRLLTVLTLLTVAAAAPAGEGTVAQYEFYGRWRHLARQLPGGYRFIDRLDLTEEQKKALDNVYDDWQTERREQRAEALKSLPKLSKGDRKDKAKVRAYYEKRRDLLRETAVPPPVELVGDILTADQLARIREANQVVDEWNRWLAAHVKKYEARLDALLGPVPADEPASQRYAYRAFAPYLDGGEMLGRVGLDGPQTEKLQSMRKEYYREYSAMMGPLWQSLRDTEVSAGAVRTVRTAISHKGRSKIQQQYGQKLKEILTDEQLAQLRRADAIMKERDAAIWERYERYLAEISAILPYPERPEKTAAADRPETEK